MSRVFCILIRLFQAPETPEPPLACPPPVIRHRIREFNGGERTYFLPMRERLRRS